MVRTSKDGDFMFYWNVYNYDSQKEEKIEISIEKY